MSFQFKFLFYFNKDFNFNKSNNAMDKYNLYGFKLTWAIYSILNNSISIYAHLS